MRAPQFLSLRRSLFGAMLCCALLSSNIALSQDPDDEPAPQSTQNDSADEAQDASDDDSTDVAAEAAAADASDDAADEPGADGNAPAAVADAADDADDATTEDPADDAPGAAQVSAAADDEPADAEPGTTVADLQEWEPAPMSPTEMWAPPVTLRESDYLIPVDTQLDPTGEEWVALEPPMPARPVASRPSASRPAATSNAARAAAEDVITSGRMNAEEMPVLRRPQPGARPLPTDRDDTPYSTGGKPIRAFGAPWQVQIYYPDNAPEFAEGLKQGKPLWQLQHFCGGALIADNWVLTAAHCIDDDMVRAGYRVRVGATDISKGDGISYKIDRIVRHSQYRQAKLPNSPNMFMNDIALIRIVADTRTKGAPDPQQVRPIALNNRPVADGAVVAATGWGKTEVSDDDRPSAVLMRVVLQVMNTDRCRKLPGYGPQRISDRVICAADTGRSTCRGDSGGALTLASGTTPVAVGIVSWGKGRCSGDGQPGAYTRVDQYLDWIRTAMALPPTKTSLP